MSTSNTATATSSGSTSQPTRTTLTARDDTLDEDNLYDEIEIEDMTYDPSMQIYHYPCPCGDRFEIYIGDMRDGQDIAVCPSCSLMIRVIFEAEDVPKENESKENEDKKEADDKDEKKDS